MDRYTSYRIGMNEDLALTATFALANPVHYKAEKLMDDGTFKTVESVRKNATHTVDSLEHRHLILRREGIRPSALEKEALQDLKARQKATQTRQGHSFFIN